MKTFNNDPKLKEELVNSLRHHQKLDAFVQGEWLRKNEGKIEGDGFRGCFYGCTMQTSDNPIGKFSEKYHIDIWFVALTERIFEGLPFEEAKKFPLCIIENLPVGVDLDLIKSEWFKTVLSDQLRFCGGSVEVEAAIKKCINLFDTPFNKISQHAAMTAAESAEYAVWCAEFTSKPAAWSAAWAAKAVLDTDLTYWSARSTAWSATWAAESTARTGIKENHYVFLANTLVKLLN